MNDTLKKLSVSKTLASFIPTILQSVGATHESLNLILELLKDGTLSIQNLVVLRYGSPLRNLNPEEIIYFCKKLADFGPGGAAQAFEILYMNCFGTPGRFEQYKEQFIEILSKKGLLYDLDTSDALDIYNWTELVKKYIPDSSSEFSEHICKELINFCGKRIENWSAIRYLKEITAVLLEHQCGVTWPYFADALLEEKNQILAFGVRHLFETDPGETKKADESPLVHIPYDYMKKWCEEEIPKRPAIVIGILPIIWEENDKDFGIDELSKKILLDYGMHKEVQHAAACQIFSFSSWGSREPYYLRRIKALKDLKCLTKNQSLKNWIDTIIVRLERDAIESKIEHEEFKEGIFNR